MELSKEDKKLIKGVLKDSRKLLECKLDRYICDTLITLNNLNTYADFTKYRNLVKGGNSCTAISYSTRELVSSFLNANRPSENLNSKFYEERDGMTGWWRNSKNRNPRYHIRIKFLTYLIDNKLN